MTSGIQTVNRHDAGFKMEYQIQHNDDEWSYYVSKTWVKNSTRSQNIMAEWESILIDHCWMEVSGGQ